MIFKKQLSDFTELEPIYSSLFEIHFEMTHSGMTGNDGKKDLYNDFEILKHMIVSINYDENYIRFNLNHRKDESIIYPINILNNILNIPIKMTISIYDKTGKVIYKLSKNIKFQTYKEFLNLTYTDSFPLYLTVTYKDI